MDHGTPAPARLFLALDPPQATRDRLAALGTVAAARWGGRPVPARNLHLTLAFVGRAGPDAVELLRTIVRGFAGTPAPTAVITGLVGRPSRRSRLCAAEVADEHGLLAVMESIRARLAADLGPQLDDRPPWPHVTVARFGRVTSVAPVTLPDEHAFAFDRMSLYDSRTVHGGAPRYVPVAAVRFGTVVPL
jgi:2'-5' RNA ligase